MNVSMTGSTRLRRSGAALLLCAVLGPGLAACSGDADAIDTAPAPTFVTKGKLSVCSDMPYAPFESVKNGEPVGFDIDLVGKIAERLDVDLNVIDTDFEDIQSGKALNQGECDLVISALTITGDRARVLDFSSPYFSASQALVAKAGSGIDSLDSLAGRKVGVQAGTTGEVYLSDHVGGDVTVVPLPDSAAMNAALADGRTDAAFYDSTIVAPYLAEHPDMEVAAEFDTGEQYAMATKKDGASDLLRVVNDELAALQESGDYDTIHDRWFGAEQ